MKYPPIPRAAFPENPVGLIPDDEPLIDIVQLQDSRLKPSMEYFRQGLPGAVPRCLLRRSAAERLQKAADLLPDGYGFRIYDAWRPMRVQQALFDRYRQMVVETAERPLSEEEILQRVRVFISVPSDDPAFPPAHTTGGAVDLTVTDKSGRELPMGTGFDDFTDAAATDYFESRGPSEPRDNRRLLYACMTAAGFINLPSEWWHYDYGDNFWSCRTGRAAFYAGIPSETHF